MNALEFATNKHHGAGGTGEVAQLVKRLLHTHEAPSLVSVIHVKWLAQAHRPVIPKLGRQRQEEPEA